MNFTRLRVLRSQYSKGHGVREIKLMNKVFIGNGKGIVACFCVYCYCHIQIGDKFDFLQFFSRNLSQGKHV